MTQRERAHALRTGFRLLAKGRLDNSSWRRFANALGGFVRREQVADREDFLHSFIEWLLTRREVLDDCLEASDDELPRRCGQLVRRHAHEAETKTEAGKLRKALDDVLRTEPRLVEHGRLIVARVDTLPPMPSGPFHACGTRLDHSKLADAAVCVAHESGGVAGRSALARELTRHWELDRLPDDFYSHRHERSAEDRMALNEAIAHAAHVLEPRERRLVGDAVLGLPLRTAKERVGLSMSAAHDARRCAGRKLAEIAAEHGLSKDDRLHLVEALAA